MNYVPVYKIYQILIVVPLTGFWVLDTAALLPFNNRENNGGVRIIPWPIFSPQTALAQVSTQPIVPEADSTNTVVTPVSPSNNSSQTRFDVTGGKRSEDNSNLFHSFSRFNLGENQVVNFISNPSIKNILTRVTGGDVSVINGLIQVTGGNSNLFIMNPAGVIFGANSRLDVPASFVVTTGSSIGFDNGWFNAIGENNYDILTGNPSSFSFPLGNSGAIINAGELSVEAGESVTLLGGTIINTGKISAPGGEITISTVPEENLVRISQEGRLLSLEISTENGESLSTNSTEESERLNPLSIPELLTGNSEVMEMATGVMVNDDNQVVLTGSNQVIPTDLGTTIVSGSLDISSAESSELLNTSRINILGEKVGLFDAKLNASGIYGSGNIRIGGDFSGLGNVPHALRTYVDEQTQISATSFLGEGGNIVISSVEETIFLGKIEAIGYVGEESVAVEENSAENIVEISSQGTLIFDGTVNLGSSDSLGNLLLKGENINIVDGNIDLEENTLTEETATESEIPESSIEENTLTEETATESEIPESSIEENSLTGEIATESEIPESSIEENSLTEETAIESEIPESLIQENSLTGEIATESQISKSSTSIENNPLTGEIATESQISKSSIETISNTNIRIEASDNITINNLSEAGLNFANRRGKISFLADSDQNGNGSFRMDLENTINTQGAGISISGTTINTGNINTKGGELNLSSSQGFIMTNNLSTTYSNTTRESNGGDINIDAQGDIITGEINSSGDSRGGNININSQTGKIEITTAGINATSANGRGGNVTINAATDIDTENIDADGEQSGGNIDIKAENTINLRAISTSSDSTETGNISLTGNEINLLGGENSISSNGKLTLHSASENHDIILGGFKNTEGVNGNSPLHLTTSDLATLADGFASISIGKSENGGTITIYSPENSSDNGVTFHDPVTMQAETITGTGTITGTDDAKITLNANRDILTGDISAPGDISINSIQGDVKIGDVTTNTLENNTGNIDIVTGGFIETGNLTTTGTTTGGKINIEAGDRLTTGSINSSATSGNAGEVKLSSVNQIEVGAIEAEGTTAGGKINLESGDRLTTDSINSSATSGNAGEVKLSATNNIEVGAIEAKGTTGGNVNLEAGDLLMTGSINSSATSGSAGEVKLSAQNNIEVGAIEAKGTTAGGKINLESGDRLTTGTINSSATSGNAGEVKLSSVNQIEVGAIEAEGTTAGGKINLESGDRLTTDSINSSA
ncbi:MAG: filamentous hemagglutinin N-terminal domain-containing protein, partial [Okeania sp. SIO3I5]|uniref:two-partner secretion domain-containing protein n=1 Tax=Okeania sp. SIO3I5 TaxID=2607805 RepID=UPI0013BDC0FB